MIAPARKVVTHVHWAAWSPEGAHLSSSPPAGIVHPPSDVQLLGSLRHPGVLCGYPPLVDECPFSCSSKGRDTGNSSLHHVPDVLSSSFLMDSLEYIYNLKIEVAVILPVQYGCALFIFLA